MFTKKAVKSIIEFQITIYETFSYLLRETSEQMFSFIFSELRFRNRDLSELRKFGKLLGIV